MGGPPAFYGDLFVFHRGPNLFIPKKNKAALFLYGCLQRKKVKSSSLGVYRTTLGGDWWETEAVKKNKGESAWGERDKESGNVEEERKGKGGKAREQWENEKGKWDGARQERAGELWLLCSMLFRMAPLPNSLKRPGLRFGPRPKGGYQHSFEPSCLLPPKPDFTHVASINLVCVCWSLKCGATWHFHAVLNSLMQVMAVVLIVG